MLPFIQSNLEFLLSNSKKTSSDIILYIYSQGKEQFKIWISKKIFDWLGSQIISLIFIKKEITCNNSIGKSLEVYFAQHVYTPEKLSSSGTVVPKSFLEKKLKIAPPKKNRLYMDNNKDIKNESWVLIPTHNSITNFIYRGQYFWVSRKKATFQNDDKKSIKRTDSSGDTFILTTFWFSNKTMDHLITTCHSSFNEKNKRNLPMYMNGEFVGHVPERKMDTILLPIENKEYILTDIVRFLESDTELWYLDNGIPYRRGYLLYGPPGCGKTSFVKALSNQVGLSLYIINLSSSEMDDQKLLEMIHSCTRSIILFEDIDSVFSSIEDDNFKVPEEVNKRRKKVVNHITFSGLLNALDGVYAQEGNLIFMTTNHKEKLDPALIRPGRIDFEIEFGLANRECCLQLFKNFYTKCSSQSLDSFIHRIGDQISTTIPEGSLSIAQIQGHFLKYRDPQVSLDKIGDLVSLEN